MGKPTADNCSTVTDMLQIFADIRHICPFGKGNYFAHHFFNPSEVKPKPIVPHAYTFSRALCQLRVITSSFDGLAGLSQSFLTGQSNYFGFGFTTLN